MSDRQPTDKQLRFAQEYLVDLNATQAALRAGYSEKRPSETGYQLLQNPTVQRIIQELASKRSARTQITADMVLSELLLIARSDVREAFDENGNLREISEIPEHVARSISGIEIDAIYQGRGEDRTHIGFTKKVKFWPKVQALDLLGKHLKIFTEVIEHRDTGIYRSDFADGVPVHPAAVADLPN